MTVSIKLRASLKTNVGLYRPIENKMCSKTFSVDDIAVSWCNFLHALYNSI